MAKFLKSQKKIDVKSLKKFISKNKINFNNVDKTQHYAILQRTILNIMYAKVSGGSTQCIEALQILKDNGIDFRSKDCKDNKSILIFSITFASTELMQWILKEVEYDKELINAQTSTGHTAYFMRYILETLNK